MLDVNVLGVIHGIHSVLQNMIKRQTGTIINISSGWGRSPEAGLAAYCASKYALEGFTGVIAKENEGVVTIVSLDPREGVATGMLAKCVDKAYYDSCPSADEWAKTAVPYIMKILPKQSGEKLTVPEILNKRKLG